MSGLGRIFADELDQRAQPRLGEDHFIELARYDLAQEFIKDESGDLSDAFDGSLYDPLRSLGRALADGSLSKDGVQMAIDAFRKEVDAAADRYAEPRVLERARSMAEEE